MATGTKTTKVFQMCLEDLVNQEKQEKGISQNEIACRIGIAPNSLSKYLNDCGEAGINALEKISRYFNVSTDYLLGLSKTKTNDMTISQIGDYTGLTAESVKTLHNNEHGIGALCANIVNYLLTLHYDGAEFFFSLFMAKTKFAPECNVLAHLSDSFPIYGEMQDEFDYLANKYDDESELEEYRFSKLAVRLYNSYKKSGNGYPVIDRQSIMDELEGK